MKEVSLITDGACLGNPGPGGWAALLRHGESEKLITGTQKDTTNNRMELTAVIRGLQALKERVRVTVSTDSRYVHDAMVQGWLRKWRSNGWKTAGGDPVANQDLWRELAEACEGHDVEWRWVRGHNGDPDNELVDDAARKAAQDLKDGNLF